MNLLFGIIALATFSGCSNLPEDIASATKAAGSDEWVLVGYAIQRCSVGQSCAGQTTGMNPELLALWVNNNGSLEWSAEVIASLPTGNDPLNFGGIAADPFLNKFHLLSMQPSSPGQTSGNGQLWSYNMDAQEWDGPTTIPYSQSGYPYYGLGEAPDGTLHTIKAQNSQTPVVGAKIWNPITNSQIGSYTFPTTTFPLSDNTYSLYGNAHHYQGQNSSGSHFSAVPPTFNYISGFGVDATWITGSHFNPRPIQGPSGSLGCNNNIFVGTNGALHPANEFASGFYLVNTAAGSATAFSYRDDVLSPFVSADHPSIRDMANIPRWRYLSLGCAN
ncbi:MAG: hypothetical protein H6707_02375 [Deltaproteobacteria bacterium]|nr:hypothetical protein [Deltaproteobacteria bacterium]